MSDDGESKEKPKSAAEVAESSPFEASLHETSKGRFNASDESDSKRTLNKKDSSGSDE